MLVLFCYAEVTDSNIVFYNGTNDKSICVKPGNSGIIISLGYDGDWKGGQKLNGNVDPVINHWDYIFIEIRNGEEFYIKV